MPDARSAWQRARRDPPASAGIASSPSTSRRRAADRAGSRSLVLHGFPTSSFDFHQVADDLAADRRVLFLDFLGYGYSDKPDLAYSARAAGRPGRGVPRRSRRGRLALLSHDMGDTVGGRLLARQMEGRWPVTVTRRVLTNGSIYIAMAHLTDGQQLLLSLPDAALPPASSLDPATVEAGLAITFSPSAAVDPDELTAMAALRARTRRGPGPPPPHPLRRAAPGATRRVTPARSRPTPHRSRWCGRPTTPSPWPRWPTVWRRPPLAPGDPTRRGGHYPMVEAPVALRRRRAPGRRRAGRPLVVWSPPPAARRQQSLRASASSRRASSARPSHSADQLGQALAGSSMASRRWASKGPTGAWAHSSHGPPSGSSSELRRRHRAAGTRAELGPQRPGPAHRAAAARASRRGADRRHRSRAAPRPRPEG